MKVKRLLYGVFLCFILFIVRSENLISSQFYGFLDEEIDFDYVFSDLPAGFDLSNASIFSFKKLPFFTIDSAHTVVAFRDSLSTEYILAHSEDIPGLSPMEYAVLRQISYTQKPFSLPRFSGSFRQGFIHNPQKEKIYESKYYVKLHAGIQKGFNVSIIGERDPFESRALDLFSGNAEIRLDRIGARIVLGDFRPGFGQGLLFSRYGRFYGNGAGVMSHDRVNVANTSYEESRYLRGGYMAIKRWWVTTQTWFSIRRLDATIDDSGKAVTIRDSGYHVLSGNRENLTEKIHAARCIVTPVNDLSLAATGVLSYYTPALSQKEGESYYHDPEGSVFRHVAIDGTFKRGPVVFFLEHAIKDSEESAFIGGLNITKKKVRSCIVFRQYSEGYWAPRAGGFSAFGEISNEKGVYSALQADLPYMVRIIASMDIARMLYRTKTKPLPVSRKRLNIVIKSNEKRGFVAWLGLRSTDDTEYESRRWNCRIGLEKRRLLNNIIRVRTKCAWSEAGGRGGPYFETALLLRSRRFRCDVTGGIFDLPSYRSRFYRYEYDVPGRGYTRAVWGRGGTFAVVLGLKLISIRYRYSDSDLMETSKQVTLQFDAFF